jgi:deoxyribonuclease V
MIFAVDVYYRDAHAIAAGVMFDRWEDDEPISKVVVQIKDVAAYIPGQFYQRELPCILELVNQLRYLPTYIIVDGYVYLDETKKPGLGKYLYDALEGKSIVIGVAKSRFKDISTRSELFRGTSRKPLHVTAEGIDESEAKSLISRMYGEHRIPAMLKLVDNLSREPRLPNSAPNRADLP